MELIERVEQLERELKARRPDLHFPSAATLGHRLRWLEIVLEEMRAEGNHGVYADTMDEKKLRQVLEHSTIIKGDRITKHSLTADPASCVAGDTWFRSDLGKVKLAVDTVVANAKLLAREPVAGTATIVRKTADEAVNNSTTYQNDNDLFLAVGVSEIWHVFAFLICTAPSTNSYRAKFQWTAPTGGAVVQTDQGRIGSASASYAAGAFDATYPGLIILPNITPAKNAVLIWLVYVGGANAGNLQLQWAQETAYAEDTKVLANSFIMAYKLA